MCYYSDTAIHTTHPRHKVEHRQLVVGSTSASQPRGGPERGCDIGRLAGWMDDRNEASPPASSSQRLAGLDPFVDLHL